MKRLILTFNIGAAILLLGPCNGIATSGMQFSLLDDQSRDTSPSIMVTFPDGYSDKIILRKHNHNEKDKNENECSYYGHLFKEKETCVAMTGCVGSEDILFTIMSAHSPGSSHFLWNQEGEAYTVEPYEFLQDEMKLMNLEKTDFARSDFFKAKNPDLKMRELEEDVCYYLKPPATALLNIKVAFTEQVFDSVGRNFTKAEINIKRAFAHVQTQYCHPSLGVKIHININEVIFLEGETQEYIQHNGDMVAHMKDVTENIMETGNTLNTTHLVVYIMGHGEGAGESQADSPCTTDPRNRYVLNSGSLGSIGSILAFVWVVRHELGHAMGMMHYESYSGNYPEWDCGPGANIMGGGKRAEWSPCNALDYRRMYTQYHDDWCMPEYPAACSLEERDKSMLVFQIEDNNGNVLEDTRDNETQYICPYGTAWGCSVRFELNEFKDSQFWFLDKNPGSDYGYIASNKYVPGQQEGRGGTRALSITGTSFEDLYQVRLNNNDLAEIYQNGKWIPICGHWFWNNNKGATLFCQQLGYTIGIVKQESIARQVPLPDDGFRIGECETNDIWGQCTGGCNDHTIGGTHCSDCRSGAMAGLRIECSNGNGNGNLDYEYREVGYEEIVEEGNPKQLWKKVGNHLISRYNGAILGAHETEGLVVISRGETDTVVPVSINEDATTSFEFSVPDCPSEDVITAADGTFEIKNMVTGNYLSLDESSKVIMAASNLGWYSQWIWKPKGGSNPDGIWGYIKPSAHDKYLSLEGPFVCEPESNGCADEKASFGLTTFSSTNMKMIWRRNGNQIVSQHEISRDSKRWSPFLLGEESNGNVIAIRASASQETNGEWNLSVPESSITSEFPNGKFKIVDTTSGKYFSFGLSSAEFSMESPEESDCGSTWTWKPLVENGILGSIQLEEKYLSIGDCQDDGTCNLKLDYKGHIYNIKKEWRRMGSLIISNEHGLVLTIDSDNNIIARKTDGLFNQDWSLLKTAVDESIDCIDEEPGYQACPYWTSVGMCWHHTIIANCKKSCCLCS